MSLIEISERVRSAETASGRVAGSTSVIAVAKLQPIDRVRTVLAKGHLLFGENRVQEAVGKWPELRSEHECVELHLVGALQSNKARAAMELFDAIHSIDRLKLAQRIAGLAQELGSCPDLFVQVNTGEELQKAGVIPQETDGFVDSIRKLGLPLRGLMCIPPLDEEPALHFGLLAKLAERNGLQFLSMGMSGDFETAVWLGATHVRIGTAIFGARPTPGT